MASKRTLPPSTTDILNSNIIRTVVEVIFMDMTRTLHDLKPWDQHTNLTFLLPNFRWIIKKNFKCTVLAITLFINTMVDSLVCSVNFSYGKSVSIDHVFGGRCVQGATVTTSVPFLDHETTLSVSQSENCTVCSLVQTVEYQSLEKLCRIEDEE